MPRTRTKRTCGEGHIYYKSTDCPTCPVCENNRAPNDGFVALLSAPARRALERNGVSNLVQLSKFTEADILKWHGIGPSSIPKLRKALEEEGFSFTTA